MDENDPEAIHESVYRRQRAVELAVEHHKSCGPPVSVEFLIATAAQIHAFITNKEAAS